MENSLEIIISQPARFASKHQLTNKLVVRTDRPTHTPSVATSGICLQTLPELVTYLQTLPELVTYLQTLPELVTYLQTLPELVTYAMGGFVSSRAKKQQLRYKQILSGSLFIFWGGWGWGKYRQLGDNKLAPRVTCSSRLQKTNNQKIDLFIFFN